MKANAAVINYHVRKAAKDKKWAESVSTIWYSGASGVSRDWVDRLRSESVHEIARKTLRYHKMRAAGQTESGYPLDKPMYTLWKELSETGAKQ